MEKSNLNSDVIGLKESFDMRRRVQALLSEIGLYGQEHSKYDSSCDHIVGYIEGRRALRCFKRNANLIDENEINFLLDISATEQEPRNKISYLMYIHDDVVRRKKEGLSPNKVATRGGLGNLWYVLKTDYIMSLGKEITEYIDSAGKENNKISCIYEKLVKEFNIASLTSSVYADLGLENINTSFDSQDDLNEIYDYVEGMRHEAAFKELICEMEDGVIEIVETDENDDARGIDVILLAKISLQPDPEGLFKFASDEEIEADSYSEMGLPVDIKSSKTSVRISLDNIKMLSHSDIYRWVMWSHVYDDDFRLSLIDGFAKLGCSKEEASIYLDYYKQFAAMKDKSFSSIRYHDKNGNSFRPRTLERRLKDIKREVLEGINTLHR
ncbi:MAG: hypothetical protein PWQ10_642 [Patescibacteria group bacterium]|nr:hypothetical protein [Patescibacteria group bacterium]